jgi:hypothetical protein
MLRKIALALVAILIVLVGRAAVAPSDYVISRSIVVQATQDQVFPMLNDSKRMNSWMPWTEIDPGVQMSYSGPESGVGAKSSWQSKGQMGIGSATITESVSPTKVVSQLEYTEPMTMVQTATLMSEATEGGTRVTWSVQGKNGFIGRFVSQFMDMDQVVGSSFEKGLEKLKSTLEAVK